MTEYVKQETKIEKNCQKAYALVFRQCTDPMRSKLEDNKDYQRMRSYHDMFLLRRVNQGLTFKFNGNKHLTHALHKAKRYFYQYFQTVHTTNQQYLETFNNKVSVIDSYFGSIGPDPGLAKEELAVVVNPTETNNRTVGKSAKRLFFWSWDALQIRPKEIRKYGGEVTKNITKGRYDYTAKTTELYNLLIKYKMYYNPPKRLVY